MTTLIAPSGAQWQQERSAALEPIDVRLYLVAAGPPKVYGIEDGVRVPGGPAFVPDGIGGYVIDSAASDVLAMSMVRLGLSVWLIGEASVIAPTGELFAPILAVVSVVPLAQIARTLGAPALFSTAVVPTAGIARQLAAPALVVTSVVPTALLGRVLLAPALGVTSVVPVVKITRDIVASLPTGPTAVDSQGTTFAASREGTGTLSTVGSGEYDRADSSLLSFSAGSWRTRQTFIEFDTSVIPSGATIVSAILRLYSYRDDATPAVVIEVAIKDWGAGVTTADFVAGSSLGALTKVAQRTVDNARPLGTEELFTDVAFAANIVKAGFTRVMVYQERQRTNVAPTVGAIDEVMFCSPAHATAAYRPKLTVTYY